MTTAYIPADTTAQIIETFMQLGAIGAGFLILLWFVLRTFGKEREKFAELQKEHNKKTIESFDSGFKEIIKSINGVRQELKQHGEDDKTELQSIERAINRASNTIHSENLAHNCLVNNINAISIKKREYVKKRLETNHIHERREEFISDIEHFLENLSSEYFVIFKEVKSPVGNLLDWLNQRGFTEENFKSFKEKLFQILLSEDTIENKIKNMKQLQDITLTGISSKFRQDCIDGVVISNISNK